MDRMKVTFFEMDHGDGHFYPAATYDFPRNYLSPSKVPETGSKQKEVKDA